MTATIEGQSVTCTYTPADGAPETKIFDVFIPEDVARPRISVIAGYVGDIIASDPENVIISEVEKGGKQLTKAIMDEVTERDASLQPQRMPIRATRYHGAEAAAELTVEKDFDTTPGALEGKTVIIIDEVVDAAVVAEWSIKRARELGAKAVIFVTLANKPNAEGRREINPDLFIVGFDNIPEWAFLLGWGMDWHEDGRELTAIYRERDPRTAGYTVPDMPARILQAA
jgi:hypoxanthine-guanine phosphoribosyltransferase